VAGFEPPYVLAVDVGSSAVKAGLFDSQARSVEDTEVSVAHKQRVASDGTSEEAAGQILRATENAMDLVLEKAGRLAGEIVGVGFDCMASTVLGVDAEGTPVTPVYTYADRVSAYV
jgi:gluconokinase